MSNVRPERPSTGTPKHRNVEAPGTPKHLGKNVTKDRSSPGAIKPELKRAHCAPLLHHRRLPKHVFERLVSFLGQPRVKLADPGRLRNEIFVRAFEVLTLHSHGGLEALRSHELLH